MLRPSLAARAFKRRYIASGMSMVVRMRTMLPYLWQLGKAEIVCDGAGYFQPVDLRVNRAGSAGLASGAASLSPEAS